MDEKDEEIVVNEEQLVAYAQASGLGPSEDLPLDEQDSELKPVEVSAEEKDSLKAGMEALLFMSDRPLSIPKTRSILNKELPLSLFRQWMSELCEEYQKNHHGIEIVEVGGGFQIRTKPQMSAVLRKMVKTVPLKLSPTNLEVLAIIAYKQPLTKDEVDQIRGVDSGYVIRNLMEKRLVRIIGRSDLPGRPMLYGTTHEFLELFSLRDLKSLPPLHEIEAMVAVSEIGAEEERGKALHEFSEIVQNSNTVLFEDKQYDEDLEALRSEIASIPTSTAFIDEQKAFERRHAKIEELIALNLELFSPNPNEKHNSWVWWPESLKRRHARRLATLKQAVIDAKEQVQEVRPSSIPSLVVEPSHAETTESDSTSRDHLTSEG